MDDLNDLKLLLSTSRRLLEACYHARQGFKEGTRCQEFCQTYPEVRLEAGLPHGLKYITR